MIVSSLLSWTRSLKTHRWWHSPSPAEYNRSWRLARSLFLLLTVLPSRDTYRRGAPCRARFGILVLFAQANETLERLARPLSTGWVGSSIPFERPASELSRGSDREQGMHRRRRRGWWCGISHRKKDSYRWRMCRFYCTLVRLMDSVSWLSLTVSCASYGTWFWWVSAAMWAPLPRWSYRAERTNPGPDRWFREGLLVGIQWTQRPARSSQVEPVAVHGERYLCPSPNDSAKPPGSLPHLREVCRFRCRPARVLRLVNRWWTIPLSTMWEHRHSRPLTSKICFKVNGLIRRPFHLIYNWLSWCQ